MIKWIIAASLAFALLMQGCALVGMGVYLENREYQERVTRGEAPPNDVVRRCNYEALVRDSDGKWVVNLDMYNECLARAGYPKRGK